MKPSISISPLAAAVAMGLAASTVPMVASAGVSSTIAASNMYLWRGQNLSNSNPQVSGSLDYSHDMGLYGGIWASSEGASGNQEYDLYVGFSGEVEGFGYDIQLIDYNYPRNTGQTTSPAEDIGDLSELILTFSAGPASLQIASNLQGENSTDADAYGNGTNTVSGSMYYALGYSTDLIGVTLGIWDLPNPTDDSMTHLDISLYVSDEVTLTASQIVDNPDASPTVTTEAFADDLIFAATWSKTFDL